MQKLDKRLASLQTNKIIIKVISREERSQTHQNVLFFEGVLKQFYYYKQEQLTKLCQTYIDGGISQAITTSLRLSGHHTTQIKVNRPARKREKGQAAETDEEAARVMCVQRCTRQRRKLSAAEPGPWHPTQTAQLKTPEGAVDRAYGANLHSCLKRIKKLACRSGSR